MRISETIVVWKIIMRARVIHNRDFFFFRAISHRFLQTFFLFHFILNFQSFFCKNFEKIDLAKL